MKRDRFALPPGISPKVLFAAAAVVALAIAGAGLYLYRAHAGSQRPSPTTVNSAAAVPAIARTQTVGEDAASAVPPSGNRVALVTELPAWMPVTGIARENYPPKPFRDDGACPFEGCSYGGRWQATRTVPLYAGAGSREVVGQVSAGEIVMAVTGVDITLRAGVARPHKAIEVHGVHVPAGDVIYLLTYHGEGAWTTCYRGHLLPVNDELWGNRLADPVAEWWVKLVRGTGETGWTKDTRSFKGKSKNDEPIDAGSPQHTPVPDPRSVGSDAQARSAAAAAELVNQASALFRARRYSEALEMCKQALRLDHQNRQARELGAQIQETMRILGADR